MGVNRANYKTIFEGNVDEGKIINIPDISKVRSFSVQFNVHKVSGCYLNAHLQVSNNDKDWVTIETLKLDKVENKIIKQENAIYKSARLKLDHCGTWINISIALYSLER